MTAGVVVSCQTMRQKWETVSDLGPWTRHGQLRIHGHGQGVSMDRRTTYLRCNVPQHRVRGARPELDGRGIDVVAGAVGDGQAHAVALEGVDVEVSIAVADVVAVAAGPRRGLLVGVGGLAVDAQQALALLPLEINKLLVDVCGSSAGGVGHTSGGAVYLPVLPKLRKAG
jgi:hypothetical protein